ncbi:WxL protein peptidoglycan domain-containing protein [Paenibacillus silvae]|uniref:COG1470 family protein n=1 Tax=Paenibacillus silvae TaxID=1325358 RepID=UPI003CF88C4F
MNKIKIVMLMILVSFIMYSTRTYADNSISSFTASIENSQSSSGFMKSVRPGDEVKVKVKVNNVSKKEKEFTIYPTDVLSDLRGGWSYPLKDTAPSLFGTWIKETPETVKLKPNKSKEFVFTVNVPKNTKPGQYIAAIVSQEFTPAEEVTVTSGMSTQTNSNILLPLQVVLNVEIDKSTRKIEIGKLTHKINNNGLLTVFIPHINKGTILEKPQGILTLKDKNGIVLLKESYTMDSVYVKTTGLYDFNVPSILTPGKYNLDYEIKYDKATLKDTYHFQVTTADLMSAMDKADNMGNPYDLGFWEFIKEFWIWIVVVISIIILLMIVIIILLLRRRKKDEKEESVKKGT